MDQTNKKAPAATEAFKTTLHENHTISAPSDIGTFAKSIGHGPKKFFKLLKRDMFLQADTMPYQRYVDSGIFKVVEKSPRIAPNGASYPVYQTVVTLLGREFLRKRYGKGGEY